jgi:cell division transport system permease protein
MTLRYVFSELGQGLRRNLSMHVAVVLTLAVSLTLVGLGSLLNQEADKTTKYWGSQLQITVYMCSANDSSPGCTGQVTPAQQEVIEQTIKENPEVASYYYESQETALQKMKVRYPERFEGKDSPVKVSDLPAAYWITLKNPKEFSGVISAVQGLDGVSKIGDVRKVLDQIYGVLDKVKIGAFGIAAFLVLAALLLVANTIRLAAFARRREIGIMRLVGASTLYIALPFLLEAVVTAVVGVALAAGTLAAFIKYAVEGQLVDSLRFMPWVGWSEYGWTMLLVAGLGLALTLLPTLVLTRKYLKV